MKNLLGNEPIKAYLSRAVSLGQLHHTLLFSGCDGVGKSLFAKSLAETLLHSTPERIQNENHPDLHILRPEGKSGTYPIEVLRDMIDEIHKPPFESPRKVFIIYDAERMLPAAANALLKTLEEPELDSQIILLSSNSKEILPTILSRCVQLSFQPISKDLIADFLQNKRGLDFQRAKALALFSNGSLGRAIRLLENDQMEKVQRLLFDALEHKIPGVQAIEQIDAIFSGWEGLDFHRQAEYLLATYQMWVRDHELRREGGDLQLLYFQEPSKDAPSLRVAEQKVATVKQALERNVKFSACLDFLLNNQ